MNTEEFVTKEEINSLKVGQIVWWHGYDRGKIVSVNKISNKYGEVVLDFGVLWDGNKDIMSYSTESIMPQKMHLKKKKD